jgi:hypothetical protein
MLLFVNEHSAQIELWACADVITKFRFNIYDCEKKRKFTSTFIVLLVNEHSAQLDRALGEYRRDYKIQI